MRTARLLLCTVVVFALCVSTCPAGGLPVLSNVENEADSFADILTNRLAFPKPSELAAGELVVLFTAGAGAQEVMLFTRNEQESRKLLPVVTNWHHQQHWSDPIFLTGDGLYTSNRMAIHLRNAATATLDPDLLLSILDRQGWRVTAAVRIPKGVWYSPVDPGAQATMSYSFFSISSGTRPFLLRSVVRPQDWTLLLLLYGALPVVSLLGIAFLKCIPGEGWKFAELRRQRRIVGGIFLGATALDGLLFVASYFTGAQARINDIVFAGWRMQGWIFMFFPLVLGWASAVFVFRRLTPADAPGNRITRSGLLATVGVLGVVSAFLFPVNHPLMPYAWGVASVCVLGLLLQARRMITGPAVNIEDGVEEVTLTAAANEIAAAMGKRGSYQVKILDGEFRPPLIRKKTIFFTGDSLSTRSPEEVRFEIAEMLAGRRTGLPLLMCYLLSVHTLFYIQHGVQAPYLKVRAMLLLLSLLMVAAIPLLIYLNQRRSQHLRDRDILRGTMDPGTLKRDLILQSDRWASSPEEVEEVLRHNRWLKRRLREVDTTYQKLLSEKGSFPPANMPAS